MTTGTADDALADNGATASFAYPYGLTLNASGTTLYVTDNSTSTTAGSIRTIEVATGKTATLVANLNTPTGIVRASSGALFVCEASAHCILRLDANGTHPTVFAGASGTSGYLDGDAATARFSSPTNLAIDKNDNLYVTDQGAVVRKVSSTGAVTTLAGSLPPTATAGYADDALADGGATARFTFSTGFGGIAVSPLGDRIYVADNGNHAIRLVLPDGTTSTLAGKLTTRAPGFVDDLLADQGVTARFNSPSGLALDATDALYVSAAGNFAIRRVL